MLPSQRINIVICALPSYDRRPMMLRNIYGVDMGTYGLTLQAQSREEIMADKIIDEMKRFLPGEIVTATIMGENFWQYLCFVVREECAKVAEVLRGSAGHAGI